MPVKTIGVILLVITAAMILCQCDGGKFDTVPDEQTTYDMADMLVIAADGVTEYQVVRPEEGSDELIAAARDLREEIKKSSGVEPKLTDDFVRDGSPSDTRSDFEITVGDVNRDECRGLSDSLRYDDYIIRAVGGKVIITGGSDSAIIAAVNEFIGNFCKADGVYLPADTDINYR